MKTLCYGIILCVCMFSACQKSVSPDLTEPVDSNVTAPVTGYVIKKGNHYCEQTHYQLITADIIRATAKFDSSAIYTSIDTSNQGDVNKLIGFSDCGTEHQKNSARLGWSWNGNNVIIYAYAYVNSVRVIKTLGPVSLGKPFSCSVSAKRNYYHFSANKFSDSIPSHCSGFTGERYKLFPYFGGNETAPHDIYIDLVEE